MKVIANRGVIPPGGRVRYRDPDDGFVVAYPFYDRVKREAKRHRVEAGLPIPYDWDDFFDRIVCRETPRACVEVPEAPPEPKLSLAAMARNFTSSMVQWAREGFPVASYETFRARYTICAGDEDTPRCPYFKQWDRFGITKCQGCGCFSVKLKLATEKCPKGKW